MSLKIWPNRSFVMAGMGWGGGKGRGALRAREIEASGLHDEIQDRRRGVSGNAGDAWDLEAGQKNKGEEKSRCSPTDRKMFQAKPSCTCFFSSGRFPINFFGSLARRKDQWKQQQGERAGRKGNIKVPSCPWACSFVPPPASGAWCLMLGAAHSPLPHGLPAAPSNLISRKVPHASESSFGVWPCPPFHPGRRIGRWTVID